MRVLAIETSLKQGSVAALNCSGEGVELVQKSALSETQRTAKSLLPAISTLLDSCKWHVSELELICVSTGPGSFTGLRIGVTTAKSMAYALGISVAGVNTLSAIALASRRDQGAIWSVMDAQRGELFASRYDITCANPFEGPVPQVLLAEDWLDLLEPGDLVAGLPLKMLGERLPPGVSPADESCWAPQAEYVGQLGYLTFVKGQCVPPLQLVPQYHRKSAAEEKADSSHSQ